MQKRPLIMIALICLWATSVHSEDQEGPWSGNAGLGFTAITGNTETDTLNAKLVVNYDVDQLHHSFLATAINSSQNSESTAESYKATWQTKYDMNEATYVYGLADWNKDRFSSYDFQIFENVGIGRRFIDTEKHKLNGEVGLGFQQSELQDGTSQNGFTARVAGDYTWVISDNATFHQSLSVSPASDNTYIESVSELKAGIVGNIFMSLSYIVKHNTDVLPGTKNTDTFTTISLEYSF